MRAVADAGEVWEHAALVTSLGEPILGLGQLYRDRADCENVFDELKNQWGWGGFTTHDLARCRLAARLVALVYNWWNLFTRLAEPEQHLEAVTSRPLLLTAIAERIRHSRQTTLRIASTHAKAQWASDPLGLTPFHRWAPRGSTMRMVLGRSGVPAHSASPPCWRAICRTRVRPRPAPEPRSRPGMR